MGMFFARGDGLWTLEDAWERVDCPLASVHFAAMAGGHVAAIDDDAHLLWLDGLLLPCDRDVEALKLWHGHALVLSSNTDCLSVADRDGWLVTARVGMYPQDMCILGSDVLACGGADGLVHRLTLPELLPVGAYAVPGMAQRICTHGGLAHVLCTIENDGLCTRYCRITLKNGRCEPCATFPGLPGAVGTDGSEGLWIAVSDALHHLPTASEEPDLLLDGFGLIRHIDTQDGVTLVTDPVTDTCMLITDRPDVLPICEGDVSQAGFMA